ncbi:MAG: YkgJ family cysteine cluster protein [bacterium]
MQAIIECRSGCAACCIAPSISTAIPGHPDGKPAGIPCVQLDSNGLCQLFGHPERPKVCGNLQPGIDCGSSKQQALLNFQRLEELTCI